MAFATNLPTLHNDPSMWIKGHIFQEAIDISNLNQIFFYYSTVKIGFKERINREQLGNSEPFPVINMPVHLMNSEQVGVSDQFWDDQKVPYYRPSSI